MNYVGSAFRRLGDCHKECGFGDAKPVRLLAEIGKRRRAHAFEISAIGSELKVKGHDFRFAERRLKAKRVAPVDDAAPSGP